MLEVVPIKSMSENLPLLRNGKALADDDATSPPRSIIIGAPPQSNESPHTPTIDTASRRSSAIAIAAAEAILQDRKKGRSQYGQQQYDSLLGQPFRVPSMSTSIDSLETDLAAQERLADERNKSKQKHTINESHSVHGVVQQIISQIPAVVIAAGLNFMMVSGKCCCWVM